MCIKVLTGKKSDTKYIFQRLFLEKEKGKEGVMLESGTGNGSTISFQPEQNGTNLSPRVIKNSTTLPQNMNMLFNQVR